MKRFLKLLCYSLITVFLLGLGGEKVFAEPQTFKAKDGVKWINITTPKPWWSTVKTIDGTNQYVFCLDSHKHIFLTGLMERSDSLARTYNSNYKDYIANILGKAYRLGLGNGQANHTFTIGENQYTISDVDLYGIAQSAVWYAAHGDTNDDGYTINYQNWMKQGDRKSIFQYLIDSDNFTYDLQITSSGNMAMTVEGDYLVSGEYTVVSNIPATLTAELGKDSSGNYIGQMKVGDGEWTSNPVQVTNGQKIKLRISKPNDGDDGEKSVTLTITSASFVTGYNVYTYVPQGNNSADSKYQNLLLTTEKTGTKSASVTAVGNYSARGTVKVRKVDATTNEPVAGASLVLVRKDSADSTNESIISYFISKKEALINESETETDGGYYTYSNLKPGYYCIKEIKAPDGYVYNESSGYYYNDEGTAIDTNGACGYLSADKTLEISKVNKRQMVKYRKVDANGNPIAGVRVEIHDYTNEQSKSNWPYLCGITDGQGYLTEKCPEADSQSSGADSRSDYTSIIISPDSNGLFPMGWEKGRVGGIFFINEVFKDGYYNPELAFGNTTMDFGFQLTHDNYETDEKSFKFTYAHIPATKYLSFEGEIGQDDYVTVNIINDKYVNISKTDTGTGKEISGAEMVLYDLSDRDYSISDDLENAPFPMVDSWTSDGTPHTFIGVKPGNKYRLEETVAPNGYARLETYIEFTVDENGKVNLESVDVGQHATVPKGYNYLIIGNDLIVNPPNTGISLLNKIAIGGLLVFVGYEVIKIYRKKANS